MSCSFWDTLAKVYVDKYQKNDWKLATALFLVPNRRACQSLIAAFVRCYGTKPAILPQIIPILETDDENLFFDSFGNDFASSHHLPAIRKEERLFIFARMIMSKPAEFGLKQISLAQALNLALDLANLIDTACYQNLSFDKLDELVPEKYASHWQETLKLLKIITEYWPKILQERNAVDVCQQQKELIYKQADLWLSEKTQQPIIAAGITASFPMVVHLLKAITQLDNGEIYFSGIDDCADENYWNAVDESHPQFELKELLSLLELKREEVVQLCPPSNINREKFISEIMRPARVSDAWRFLEKNTIEGINSNQLQLMTCKTHRDEALAIALKMREVLNFPEKTAALITYDRNLARRVASELERFEIEIDDSAGLPLNLTPIGIFLRLIAESAEDIDSDTKFIGLLKHPFCLCHMATSDIRSAIYGYEVALRQKNDDMLKNAAENIYPVRSKLERFGQMLTAKNIEFDKILRAHIELAEDLACSDDVEGKKILWRGDAGKCAAQFVTKMLETTGVLGKICGKDYLPLLCELMGLETVRKRYGTHPRLSILGPIEARLCHFDYVILGEINEGIWPKPTQADMWMSRPMKKDFGFNLPEKAIGILAADLCCFLASEHVILTRAERVDGVPMKKSRWLLRMETVLKALETTIDDFTISDFTAFSSHVDVPEMFCPISSPAPCPPVNARPRKLSASAVDLLITDPYSVFAKYILKLYPLEQLDIPLDQRDYGTLIHGIIEKFNNLYPKQLPENALDILIKLGERCFDEANIDKELKAFWWPKFAKTAMAYVVQDNRQDVEKICNEVTGTISYSLPNGTIHFVAKADRIDQLKDGKINIVDYKTGNIPNKKQIMSGHAMQLLLEGLIATKGSFDNIGKKEINQLIYWRLGSQNSSKNILAIKPSEDEVLNKSEEFLLKLMETFDFETTPYYSRPIPKYVPKNKDYEHLARIKEWSVQEEESGDGA